MSNATRRVRRCLAVSAVVGAIAVPAASASPVDPALPGPATSADQPAPNPRPIVVTAPVEASEGFDWADAGLGAAGAVALASIGFGTALAFGYRSGRHRMSGRHRLA